MITRRPHTINGNFYGLFYFLDSGKGIYLAHRRRKDVYRAKHAWTLDLVTLRECEALGVEYVGVVYRMKKDKYFYATPVENFFSKDSFYHFGATPQRGLPLACFQINPASDLKLISSAMKLR